ncbi:hypothetical protein F5I97DRAFT_1930924 [Phlebopus sp. FC_14]|nr:hypothetical protein F5I97DRAFT_1930924 [Phlebopus sp. FC_14]
MRPYAIYEHPDFSSESALTLQDLFTALTVVAASSAVVYEIIVHTGVKASLSFL